MAQWKQICGPKKTEKKKKNEINLAPTWIDLKIIIQEYDEVGCPYLYTLTSSQFHKYPTPCIKSMSARNL